jgi:hypothetical protein
MTGHGFVASAGPWAQRLAEAVAKLPPRIGVAALYGYRLCSSEGCDPVGGYAAAAAIAAMLAGTGYEAVVEPLPRHLRHHVEKALSEAEDAYLRSPSSIYAQVGLDADALSRMDALAAALPLRPRRGLAELLEDLAESMSWAAASDYVLYTSTARNIASRILRPHTLAYAKWVAEELQQLGFEATPRTETGSGVIISYLDLKRCSCGQADKETRVKPRRECIEYTIAYTCCGDRIEVKLCAPESTRIR